ncbi:MAG: transglycosylase SLT domain-containing protein, partial [Myxococcales bacterium]|nr:transglycosylase SLT domain-containing protein [Myxococcales bacterium]
MRPLVQLCTVLLAATIPAIVHAGPDHARKPGVQADPPGPPSPTPVLQQDDGGRRAVRGCPVDHDCRPGHERLREFELEAFPPGGDPWIHGDDAAPGSLVEPAPPAAAVTRPSELRPDLPWLDDLELPDLPVRWDRRVIDYLVFYKEDRRGHDIMQGWLEDQGRFKDMIVGYLKDAGLPQDLLYVSMIESSYDPYTYSRAGASGLWQFMPAGGKIYGLEIDRWIDERNDPVRSTIAVLDYFKDLYQRFGDWHLALAAYNAGYGAVLRSIARYNTNDFWQLLEYENALPWESSIYVPKAIAAAIVGHNRELFGFGDVKPRPAEAWDDVEVPKSVALSVIAHAAGCSVDDLKRLNPQVRRNRTPAGRKYVIRVPVGGGDKFARAFPQLRGDWDDYDAYVMAHGERFEDVATQFGISPARLRKLNELEHEGDVAGGSLLVVPHISEATRQKNLIKARESLYSSGVDQRPGEPLLVPVPDKDAEIAGRKRVFYRVVAGDTLGDIARALDVRTSQLATWNGVEADAELHPRMVLQAWVAESYDEDAEHVALLDPSRILVVTRGSKEHLDLAEARVGRVRLEYTAKGKESFESIAKQFGLTARDLSRINRRSHTTVLDKGETIIVYQVVDKDRSDRAKKQWKKTPKSKRGKKGKQTAAADDGDDDD